MIGRFPIGYIVPAILLAALLAYMAFFNMVMEPASRAASSRLIQSSLMDRTQILQAGLAHAYRVGDESGVDRLLFYARSDRQSRKLYLLDADNLIIKAHKARYEGLQINNLDAEYDPDEADVVRKSDSIILAEQGGDIFSAYAYVDAGDQKYILYMVDDYTFYRAEVDRITAIPEAMGAVLLLIAVVALALFLYFTLAARLRKLTAAANAIANGKKGVKSDINGGDELAQLAKVFDKMAVDIDAERAELEEARQDSDFANRAKSDFLANMSHEIRTPLTGVLGMLEALKELNLSKDARRFAVMANRSAHSLLGLINDILDFSRLEAGKKRIRNVPMNMAKVIEDVNDSLAHQAIINEIALDYDDAIATSLWIEGDEKAIRQVLMNLIGNAIKFSGAGRIKVAVETEENKKNDKLLDMHVSVADTGDGIGEEDLGRLFDRFEQVEEFKHSQKGTGLGLAICRELVGLMKGRIWAESEVGVGSTFHFTVTVAKSESHEEDDRLRNVDVSSFKRPLRVLAVDDNLINRTVIYQIVSGLGLKAFVAEDGQAAIDQVKRRLSRNLQPFDIILMDIHMPGLDGLDTMDRIRKLGDWAARVPVIALTAHAFADQRAEFLDRGMVGYVSKPIDRNALALEIAKMSDHLNLLVHKKKKPPLKKKSSGRISIKDFK